MRVFDQVTFDLFMISTFIRYFLSIMFNHVHRVYLKSAQSEKKKQWKVTSSIESQIKYLNYVYTMKCICQLYLLKRSKCRHISLFFFFLFFRRDLNNWSLKKSEYFELFFQLGLQNFSEYFSYRHALIYKKNLMMSIPIKRKGLHSNQETVIVVSSKQTYYK